MKSKLVKIAIVLVVLVIIAGALVGIFLDSIVKKGIETVGPQVTKVSIKLDDVKISALSGGGGVKGMVIGNPEGYKMDYAIKVGEASLSVDPKSLLSDKIVVHYIRVDAPEINLEGGLKDNNLTKILANIQAFTATEGSTNAPAAGEKKSGAQKKLQVDEFTIKGAKVTVALSMLGGKPLSATLPDIAFKDLGTGPEGITIGELSTKVFNQILVDTTTAATGVVSGAGKAVGDTLNKTTKSLGDLFKKK